MLPSHASIQSVSIQCFHSVSFHPMLPSSLFPSSLLPFNASIQYSADHHGSCIRNFLKGTSASSVHAAARPRSCSCMCPHACKHLPMCPCNTCAGDQAQAPARSPGQVARSSGDRQQEDGGDADGGRRAARLLAATGVYPNQGWVVRAFQIIRGFTFYHNLPHHTNS